ncbi:MAG: ATP-binding cassette domain-containing protein, partial [Treponema sp.]|nr:ATP-binding cassette domain-containing protein [Treponema sp.]
MKTEVNPATGFVELKGFCKEYKKNVAACSDIDFYAEQGCVTGLLGPNGAGKSTMLK